MKLSHSKLLTVAGVIWLIVGVYLLSLGLNYLTDAAQMAGGPDMLSQYPLLKFMDFISKDPQTNSMILIVIGLALGYTKGKLALGKAASKTLERLNTMADPAPITALFNLKYLALIGGMMLLGMSLSFMGLAWDVRGFIDFAVGSALINGAMIYFRYASEKTKAPQNAH